MSREIPENIPIGFALKIDPKSKPYGAYILAVKEKINDIYHRVYPGVEATLVRYNLPEIYNGLLGGSIDEEIKSIVMNAIMPGLSYIDNDIYTALFHVLNSLDILSSFRDSLDRGEIKIQIREYEAEVVKLSNYNHFPELLRRGLFKIMYEDTFTRHKTAPNVKDLIGAFKYRLRLVEIVVNEYYNFLVAIFRQMEEVELGIDVSSEDIQELWKEKYAPA